MAGVVKSIFGGGSAPATPAPRPVVAMPDPRDQDEARRREMLKAQGRSGRASTLLSGDSGNYSGDSLGTR